MRIKSLFDVTEKRSIISQFIINWPDRIKDRKLHTETDRTDAKYYFKSGLVSVIDKNVILS